MRRRSRCTVWPIFWMDPEWPTYAPGATEPREVSTEKLIYNYDPHAWRHCYPPPTPEMVRLTVTEPVAPPRQVAPCVASYCRWWVPAAALSHHPDGPEGREERKSGNDLLAVLRRVLLSERQLLHVGVDLNTCRVIDWVWATPNPESDEFRQFYTQYVMRLIRNGSLGVKPDGNKKQAGR